MNMFWAILFGLAALFVIPLILEWSRGLRGRNRSQAMLVDHAGAPYSAGSVDYTPGHRGHHCRDAGGSDGHDSCGGGDGGGDGGGGD